MDGVARVWGRLSLRRRLGASALCLWIACALPAAARPDLEPDGPLILEVRVGELLLTDGLTGQLKEGRVLLPLGEFCALLEFPIAIDAAARRAGGWFVEEARRFDLDLGAGEVRLGAVGEAVAPHDAIAESGEILVEASRLSRWFGLGMEVSVPDMQVVLRPRHPLPVEQRLERQARRQRAFAGRKTAEGAAYDKVEAPYAWLGWPFADVSLSVTATSAEGSASRGGRYDAFVTGDVLAMGGELFVAGTEGRGLSQASLRLGRADPEGGLLGPLRATEVLLGDVFTPELPLVTLGARARGFAVSTFPLDAPAQFGQTTLAGTAPPGWEVELSRDGALLDFLAVGSAGTFEFTAVPVLFGPNVFTLTHYGPNGQRRQETRRLYAGPGLTPVGQSHVRVGVTQQDRDLLGVSESEGGPGQGRPRLSARWERGLVPEVAGSMSCASVPLDQDRGRRHTYLSLGASGAAAGVFASVEAVRDLEGGTALQAAAQSAWGDLQVLAEHRRFWAFAGEGTSASDPARAFSRLRLDAGPAWGAGATQGLELEREDGVSGAARVRARHRLSGRLGAALGTHHLSWEQWREPGHGSERAWRGDLLVSSVVGAFSSRAETTYTLAPTASLRAASLSADGRFAAGTLTLSLSRNLEGHRRSSAALGWSRAFGPATVALQASAADDSTFSLGATLEFGLGREPCSGSWRAGSGVGASRGRALARVTLDRDGNGIADPSDLLLENVSFLVNRAPVPGVLTGAGGTALLPDLPPWRFAEVAVDGASLEDPFWEPSTPGYRVLARPGATPVLEFLVQETGEIDGNVFVRRGEEVRRAAGARVQRIDGDGRVVQEVVAGFDGYYLFQRVPLGTHRLRLPGAAPLQGPEAAGGREVVLATDRPVASGVDWMMEEPSAP